MDEFISNGERVLRLEALEYEVDPTSEGEVVISIKRKVGGAS